jgi:hypothetical protein
VQSKVIYMGYLDDQVWCELRLWGKSLSCECVM